MSDRLLIQIVGAYRADTINQMHENIHTARDYGIEILKLGHYVFIPHTHTALMDGIVPDQHFLKMALHYLTFADAIFKLPHWFESKGSIIEIEEAKRLKLKIYDSLHQIERVRIDE